MAKQGLLKAGSRFLDVGCYEGQFLAGLPENIKKAGIDIDEQAISRGRKNHKEKQIEFILADFDKFLYEKPIDTISMFHVLEHLPDPLKVLRNLRTIAQTNTQLVVEVPILENGITNDINGFFSVQHMTHFSRRSLTNCLLRSGWKIEEWLEQPDYNGCRVLATPQETVENIIGNREDIGTLYHYLAAWYNALKDVNRKLNQTEKTPQYVIWGAGLHTEFLYQVTSLFHNKSTEFAIIDSDPLKQGKTWRGIHIHHPETLTTVDWSNAILVISSYGSQNIIAENCINSGVPKERIVQLYDTLRVY
ncbi:MAG: class I SAM-dependent methyltransferase [Proteobacteria bacterium]|nr:class I SAM-dependent methyltransferase [Pseudomonadota bacterium]